MRVAFDLDNTLIPYADEFSTAPPLPVPLRWWFREPLRVGTGKLLRELRAYGCDIWIYTTSGRDPTYLKLWFLCLGVPLGGIINCRRHETLMRGGKHPTCSKYPPAYGIDLLIDDSDGVQDEGRRYGFDVLLLATSDANWTETVMDAIKIRYRKIKREAR